MTQSIIDRPIKAHSELGASIAHRWMTCPGSVQLSRGIPQVESDYAKEGTLAHAIAEKRLKGGDWPQNIDPEMKEAIQLYVSYVQSQSGRPWFEVRFDLSSLYPGCFGTADSAVYDEMANVLFVNDYKHGQGIPVEVIGNKQMLHYALGAYLTLGLKNVRFTEMTIIQPRAEHRDGPIRSWRILTAELLDFALDLVECARATEAPDAPLVSGKHCRWCPAAPTCPELNRQALTLAKQEFAPVGYDPKKLSEALLLADRLDNWITEVRIFAHQEATHGRTPPGFKLVEKRASRKWGAGVEDRWILHQAGQLGFSQQEVFTKPEPISPAQMEKLVGKKAFKVFEEVVVKESTGTKLVHESEKGAPVTLDAKTEFSKVEL